jgi:hypothetical protein
MPRKNGSLFALAALAAVFVLAFSGCDVAGFGMSSKSLSEAQLEAKGISPAGLKPNQYVIGFDPQGGDTALEAKVVKLGLEYGDLPVATRLGFAFGGWYTEPEGSGSRVVSTSKVSLKANHTLYARWNLMPAKIAGTAAIGTEAFFFELDILGNTKTMKIFVPSSEGSYITDGKIEASSVSHDLAYSFFNPSSYVLAAKTLPMDGAYYEIQGYFSPAEGFSGYIFKIGPAGFVRGILAGSPIYPNTKVQNYIGEATYLFPTPTPQTLLFNALIDFEDGSVAGSWCETGQGWDYSLHGMLGGSMEKRTMSFDAGLLPAFSEYLLGPMTASGGGRFKNAHEDDISGFFNIEYMGMSLPSTLTAAKAPD